MERGQEGRPTQDAERKHPIIIMIVDEIKVARLGGNLREHPKLIRASILKSRSFESKPLGYDRYEPRLRDGVARRKERHFDVLFDETSR